MKKKQQTSLSSFFGAAASKSKTSKSASKSKTTSKPPSKLEPLSKDKDNNANANNKVKVQVQVKQSVEAKGKAKAEVESDELDVNKENTEEMNLDGNAIKVAGAGPGAENGDNAPSKQGMKHKNKNGSKGVNNRKVSDNNPNCKNINKHNNDDDDDEDDDDDGLMDTTDDESEDKNQNQNKTTTNAKNAKNSAKRKSASVSVSASNAVSSITGKPIRSKKNRKSHIFDDDDDDDDSDNNNHNEDQEQDQNSHIRRKKSKRAKLTTNAITQDDNHDLMGDEGMNDIDDIDEIMDDDDLDDDEDDFDEDDLDEDDIDEDIDDLDEDDIDDEENVTLESLQKSKAKSKTKTKTTSSKAKSESKSTKKNAFDLLKQQPTSKPKKSNSKANSSPNTNTNSKAAPDTKNYDDDWKPNTPIPYSTLTQTLSKIEAITSRLEIQSHLTSLFSQTIHKNPADLINIVYLASNTVAPAYQCVELGIGDAILIKAVSEASGSSANIIKTKYDTQGDLGTVALHAKSKQQTLGSAFGFGFKCVPKPLQAVEVLEVFRQIAAIVGSQSRNQKVSLIKGLLVRATAKGDEAKYIIRGLQGKLRIGLAQSTVLISLAHAVVKSCSFDTEEEHEENDKNIGEDNDQKQKQKQLKLSIDCQNVKNTKTAIETRLESAVNIVKKAYSEVSSFDTLVEALISVPLYKLHEKCSLRPGNPVTPMLAKPTKSIQEVLKRLDGKRFTCEYKYDGERAQVHMQTDGVTKVFSRSLLDTSEKFPEVPLYVKEACVKDKVTSFILDTEVVAYNRETKQFVPFQILSTRKKTEESTDNAKVKVIVQAFDLMYLNGQSLLDHTLAERRALLLENFKVVDGKFQFAKSLDHKEDGDTIVIEAFLDAAVKGQCEGLMVKTLDENASYQPSKRSLNWLKLKKDYLDTMGDSVDLVPIGAYYGKGKRTGVYGAYLLACYDVDSEEFQSVCKLGTGFSDEDLKTLSSGLNGSIISGKSAQYNVASSLECDVWFDACQVWEVKAADLSKSPVHTGAIDKTGEGRGIGLRFPRYERLRDDKKPENATTSDQILEMYYAQDSIVDDGAGDDEDDGI